MNEYCQIYDESSLTEESVNDLKRFDIPNSENEDRIYITIDTTKPQLRRFVDFYQKKEFYYTKALKNLIVQNNFLELALQLEEGQISEDEYDEEIDNHPEKYVVNVNYLDNSDDISIIMDIIKKIGINFTIDEVADLFSIDTEDLNSKILNKE
jgi:hypothetical protein